MNGEFNELAHINCDCHNDEICKLFWNLDNFNDYEPEDELDPYERYEEEQDKKGE